MQGANTDEVEMLEKQNEKLRERERKLLQQLQSAQFELEAARAMLTGEGEELTRVQEQVWWGGGDKERERGEEGREGGSRGGAVWAGGCSCHGQGGGRGVDQGAGAGGLG